MNILEYKNYFFEKFSNDEKVIICLMAHNTEWDEFINMNNEKNNVNVEILGRSFYNFNSAPYDLIVFYDDDFFDEDLLEELTDISKKIALKYQKRVSIGYQSFIPFDERKESFTMKIIIQTINGDGIVEIEKCLFCSSKANAISLTSLCFYEHFNYEGNIKRKLFK